MSMLNRFRKKGGFQQLLNLIETCDPVKQKNLLHLVSVEDPGWAHLVKTKCLSSERIFSWPDHIIHEIVPLIPEKVAIALHASLNDIQKAKFIKAATPALKRAISEFVGATPPTSSEQNAARVKLIQIVRDLESEGKFKFQTFDPILVIDPLIAA